MTQNPNADLLNDAFNIFREASRKMEVQYALLEQRVEELNKELAEKNKVMERTRRLAAMGEMAAKIAHEIRNPLGSMAIFAALLERELSDDTERKKLAGHIRNGIKTLDNLLSNMLLFTSSPEARLSKVDLKKVIEDSVLLTRGHGKKDVDIKIDYRGPTAVMGDQGLLKQVFLNLFLNSIDALDEGGVLSVSTRYVENGSRSVKVEIKDNGKGIPEEHIDRIFDPFFSTKDRGTGLGLAIVSAVISAHRGLIDVSSRISDGTVFSISLPVDKE